MGHRLFSVISPLSSLTNPPILSESCDTDDSSAPRRVETRRPPYLALARGALVMGILPGAAAVVNDA